MKVFCPTCDLEVDEQGCVNFWCRREDRGFDVVWAAGSHDGELRRAIAALKYQGRRDRADWLGRVLAGYLVDHAGAFEDVDLIVGTPGAISPARPIDHVRAILVALDRFIGGHWYTDAAQPVLTKRAPTRSMVDLPSAEARRLWAAGELRAALTVPAPERVTGRRLLVVDDVFTDGSTLREVALVLRDAGAIGVSGLVLARRRRTRTPGSRRAPW